MQVSVRALISCRFANKSGKEEYRNFWAYAPSIRALGFGFNAQFAENNPVASHCSQLRSAMIREISSRLPLSVYAKLSDEEISILGIAQD
jgi:hypothetical protein